jgi:hypothetical protein
LTKLSCCFPKITSIFLFHYLKKSIPENIDLIVANENTLYLSLFRFFPDDIKKIVIFRNKYNGGVQLDMSNTDYYSFDFDDCKKYGFIHYNQYCSGFDYLREQRNHRPQYDVFFLGRDKGRKKILDKIILNNKDTENDFIIIPEPNTLFDRLLKFLGNKRFSVLSYQENLEHTLNTRAIIEICNEKQSGFTMRIFEALVCGKKVITNNPNVKELDFYDDSVIYYSENLENISDIKLFLNNKCEEVSSTKLEQYSPCEVLSYIIDRYL